MEKHLTANKQFNFVEIAALIYRAICSNLALRY